jgi:ankyrin repeat protein
VKLGYVVDRFLEMNEHGTISDAATALFAAVQNRQLDAVAEAIRTAPNSVFDSTEGGATALHFAAFQGYCEGLEMVLQAGADKDAPMHSSAKKEGAQATKDSSSASGTGEGDGADEGTAGDDAAGGGQHDSSGGATALHLAAISGSPECVERLLEVGAVVDAPMADGTTALAIAAYHAHTECVKQLLAAGASVHACSDHEPGDTLGGWGVEASEGGSDGNSGAAGAWSSDRGRSRSRSGSSGGESGGAQQGNSSAGSAGSGGTADSTRSAGAPFTALHYAACAGSVEIVQLLLEAGAPCSSDTSTTHSPLAVAAANGQLEVMELLIAWGALEASRAKRPHRSKQRKAPPSPTQSNSHPSPHSLYAVSLSPAHAQQPRRSLTGEHPQASAAGPLGDTGAADTAEDDLGGGAWEEEQETSPGE